MNFNSIEFILIFLPLVILLFYAVPMRARVLFLLMVSLFFYGLSGIVPLLFMIISIAWAYITAFTVSRFKKIAKVIIAISFPLLVLIMFKYLNFILKTFGAGQDIRGYFYFFLSIVLPAGISFYTFQLMCYSIDVIDGKIKPEKKPIKFAFCLSFFPQLIAGPILRYDQINFQADKLATNRILNPDFTKGLKYFSIGLFGKVFFADFLHGFVSVRMLTDAITSSDATFSILAYSFRIYYDFWAYSLMAIGLGKMFSVDLPSNFDEPYISKNPKEFWTRWHITLSSWLRDYVYIKMGGNKDYFKNIIIVFLTVGLWHGAGWNFVLWGAYHGFLVILYKLLKNPWDRLPDKLQVGLTFTLVTLGWPLFYCNLTQYFKLMGSLLGISGVHNNVFTAVHWGYLAAIGFWTFMMRESVWLYNDRRHILWDSPIAHALMAVFALIFLTFSRTFIYFQF